jgi:predicted acetyltransferase
VGEMQLVVPLSQFLPSYILALERGWSADTVRGPAAAAEELEQIRSDPEGFIASLDDRQAKGAPIALPDGSTVPRLPGFRRWMWDGEFAGSIGFRWQPGTTELPPHCLGHIGFSVVPWKRRKGYATTALKLMLPQARAVGLSFVELTTDPENVGSQRTILACGGEFWETFIEPAQFGGQLGFRYRVPTE